MVLWSKYVNNVCKLLELLGDFVPQIPYRGLAPGLHWGTSVFQALVIALSN